MYRVNKTTLELAEVDVVKYSRGFVTMDVYAEGGAHVGPVKIKADSLSHKFFQDKDDALAYVRAHGLERIEEIAGLVGDLEAERDNIQELLRIS